MRRPLVAAMVLLAGCVFWRAGSTIARADAGDDSGNDPGDAVLTRLGAYVEDYYGRAQSILAEERVTLQPLANDFGPQGFPRRLTYELRVEWDPEADAAAVVRRDLLSAKGPPLGSADQPDCLDPRSVSPEPLAFLLPARRHKIRFKPARLDRLDGRAVLSFEYSPVAAEPPIVDWRDDCATIDLPGRTSGRIWADPQTAEVLRFDEHLVGQVDIPAPRRRNRLAGPDWFTIERADTSIRYRRVTFVEPDETVLLPAEVVSLSVIRNSGVPRLRITQTFGNYRRFVTKARIVS